MVTQVTLREYQKRAISQLKLEGVNVLSICPGGGKTITATEFALNNELAFKRVLILAHGTNVLKTQWSDEFKSRGISYGNDLSSNERFVITIPQSISKKKIPQFDLVIVDEAHEFYYADKMVKSIIEKASPKCQLLLTGTPSIFISKGIEPVIISGVDVYREGYLSDPYIGCVTSAYNLDMAEFEELSGEVKSSIKETMKNTKKSFELLIEEMLVRLTDAGIMKDNPSLIGAARAAGIRKAASIMFGKLEKTMVSARNIEQAEMISEILNKYKIKNVLSTSNDDVESKNIELFKTDPSVKVLIVVRRGILGFNMPELVNVIDFTGSRNIDRIYQLYARSLRKHEDKSKFFFKLCYGLNKDVDSLYLQAALCLNNQDFIGKYNGKNLNGIDIIVPVEPRRVRGEDEEPVEDTGKRSKKSKNHTVDKNMAIQVLRLGLMSDLMINNQSNHWREYQYTKFGKAIEKMAGVKFHRQIKNITREHLLHIIKTGEIPEEIYE